jgi:hypothetical protein
VTICNSFLSKNHQLQAISDLKNSNDLPFNEQVVASYLFEETPLFISS